MKRCFLLLMSWHELQLATGPAAPAASVGHACRSLILRFFLTCKAGGHAATSCNFFLSCFFLTCTASCDLHSKPYFKYSTSWTSCRRHWLATNVRCSSNDGTWAPAWTSSSLPGGLALQKGARPVSGASSLTDSVRPRSGTHASRVTRQVGISDARALGSSRRPMGRACVFAHVFTSTQAAQQILRKCRRLRRAPGSGPWGGYRR